MSWLKCIACNRKTNESTTLFRFPAELDKRLKWTEFLGLDLEQLAHKSRLCSWHFETSAFKFTVQRGKKFVLKSSAVPTVKNVEAVATSRERSVGKYNTRGSGSNRFYYYCAACGLVDRKRTRFTFPTAEKEREQWRAFCGVEIADFKPKSHRLCIIHFKKDELIQQRAAKNKKRFLLKPGAIPTLNKPETIKDEYLSDEEDSTEVSPSDELYSDETKPSMPTKESVMETKGDDIFKEEDTGEESQSDELNSIEENAEFAETVIKNVNDIEQSEPKTESKHCVGSSSEYIVPLTSYTGQMPEIVLRSNRVQNSSLPLHLNGIKKLDCGPSNIALRILAIAKREQTEHLKQINLLRQKNKLLGKVIQNLVTSITQTEEENAEPYKNDDCSLYQENVDSKVLLGSDMDTDSESNSSIHELDICCADITSTVAADQPIHTVGNGKQDPLTDELPQPSDTKNNNEPIDEVISAPKAKLPKATCPFCKKSLNKKFIKRHIELVHMLTKDALQKCQYCTKSFPDLSLRRHIRQVHQNKKYLCDVCSTTFKTESSLRRHALTHSDKRERNYTCEVCGLKFLTLSNLTGHQTTHDSERKPGFACDLCDRSFYYKGGLTTHKKVHSSNAAECSVCKKRFPRQIDLRIHMRSHSGEMPFKCNLCPKAFRNITPYKQHLLMHQGHVFKCDICGRNYKTFDALGLHKRKHTGLPVKCKICNKGFVTNHKARLHVRRVHQVADDEEAHLLKIKQKTYVPRKNRLAANLSL